MDDDILWQEYDGQRINHHNAYTYDDVFFNRFFVNEVKTES